MKRLKCEKIGQFLKNYRNLAGLKAEDVCKFLEIESVDELYKFESGSLPIPLSMVYAFANIYEIPADKIVEFFYNLSEQSGDLDVDFSLTSSKVANT